MDIKYKEGQFISKRVEIRHTLEYDGHEIKAVEYEESATYPFDDHEHSIEWTAETEKWLNNNYTTEEIEELADQVEEVISENT